MNKPILFTCGVCLVALTVGCDRWNHRDFETAPTQHEAFLIQADNPYSAQMSPSEWEALQENLLEAQRLYNQDPANEMNIIWLGRRYGYLGMYHDAIETLTRGISIHPDSYKLRRHRGHRFITIRQFERAVDDLSRAARLASSQPDEIEPDGAPNALNIPRGTTKTNIYYHLALAHYLQGDFDAAASAWRECLKLAPNDDMRVAATYWLYLTLRRTDDSAGAAEALAHITPAMDVIENHDYHDLLLMFQDGAAPEPFEVSESASVAQATRAYGVAMQFYFNGYTQSARNLLKRVVDEANPAAFGAIAAEVELERISGFPR